jgi:hypothetical protein
MRLSIVLLLVSLAGILGGAALIGIPALGGAVIFDSLCVGVWALRRDDGLPDLPQRPEVPLTVQQILQRARSAS